MSNYCENCNQPPDDDNEVHPVLCGHDVCEECTRDGCPICLLAAAELATDPAQITRHVSPADLLTVMHKLYDSRINCGMYSYWNFGFCVFLGDEVNGIKIQRRFDRESLFEAAAWLDQKAREFLPDSDYAR